MPHDDLPRFLTPRQLAEELGVHRQTVYSWLYDGDRIPGARKIGGRWRIPRWALDEIGMPAHAVT
jgi:excisionase family DNA binding protein